jgi:hypothetical protein
MATFIGVYRFESFIMAISIQSKLRIPYTSWLKITTIL